MSSTTHTIKIQASLRRRDAVKLRVAGNTYRDIVDIMTHAEQEREKNGEFTYALPESYDARNCYRDVRGELDRVLNERQEVTSELITLELNRLDDMTSAIYSLLFDEATEAKIKLATIDRLLKISERRSKLMGLDKPQKMQVLDWRSEIIALITSGQITMEQVREELPQVAEEISNQLAERRSTGTIEVRALEAPSE